MCCVLSVVWCVLCSALYKLAPLVSSQSTDSEPPKKSELLNTTTRCCVACTVCALCVRLLPVMWGHVWRFLVCVRMCVCACVYARACVCERASKPAPKAEPSRANPDRPRPPIAYISLINISPSKNFFTSPYFALQATATACLFFVTL